MTVALQGICASKGIAIGAVSVLVRGQHDVVQYGLPRRRVEKEVARFEVAVQVAKDQLRGIKAKIPSNVPGEVAAFMDTHLLMLEDSELTSAPIAHIRERRYNAEWALKVHRDDLVSVFEAMEDPYLRSRKEDVDHVVNRIQRALSEQATPRRPVGEGRLAGRIIVADELSPADAVLMQHQGTVGFITEFGGPNSHTAILARSLRIPAVVGLHQARHYLRDEDEIVIDGRQGVVLLDPDANILRHYSRRQRDLQRHHRARRRLRRAPVITKDGERICLQANVELPGDTKAAADVGAEGIGLYRTEYLFMNRPQPPDEAEQYAAYTAVVKAAKGAPVTIRTLDLGADKQVDGSRPGAPLSTNPALGLRAVRLCLREPALFRPQLRAILRASGKGSVRMMIPMLSDTQELMQVFQLLRECRAELEQEGQAFDPQMPVGAMIEVPAAAVCADIFARHLDFLSIGTNDLIQYTIAIDRVDDEVNYLYDPLNPAVLRLIHTTIKAGRRSDTPVAMCGEMAGDARYTRLLLGMGLREFSVHPNTLLEIKHVINSSDISELIKTTRRIMRTSKPSTRTALVDELNRADPPDED
ncbi:MAG: phosphoenolpyruvate--protein phosphotransferase [Gammaproteobacteria bacterium]|nr:MAG: phosphoenolpyruvate--protein phosphotransferase [Gammaproteobacteria bacterium]